MLMLRLCFSLLLFSQNLVDFTLLNYLRFQFRTLLAFLRFSFLLN